VDETSFTASKASLSEELDGIRDKFGIDWTQTQYRDLWKPLYSGIAARLKIADYYRHYDIPQTVAEQASYWARQYTTDPSTHTVDEYRKASEALATSKRSFFHNLTLTGFQFVLDPEGGSLKSTLVVLVLLVVGISSLKIPKAFLTRSGAPQNFAHTFALPFSTDLRSQIFKLICN